MQFLLRQEHVKTIYLQTSIGTIVERVFDQRHHRPMIAHINSKDELTEFIGKHLFERRQFYALAEHNVNTDSNSENDIVEAILFELF